VRLNICAFNSVQHSVQFCTLIFCDSCSYSVAPRDNCVSNQIKLYSTRYRLCWNCKVFSFVKKIQFVSLFSADDFNCYFSKLMACSFCATSIDWLILTEQFVTVGSLIRLWKNCSVFLVSKNSYSANDFSWFFEGSWK